MILLKAIPQSIARALAFAVLLSLVSACDSDSGGDEGGGNLGAGTFELDISGGAGSISGNAIFGTATDPDEGSFFALILTSNVSSTSTGQITYIAGRGGRPATGNYPFVDAEGDLEDLPAGTFMALILDGGSPFWSKSGTLRIQSSSNSNLVGSIEFEAAGLLITEEGQEEVTRTVSGSFNAISSPVFLPF